MRRSDDGPNLADATDIPNARIYSILKSLDNKGFIEIISERPKAYQLKPPAQILERAKASRRQAYESYCADIEETAETFLNHYEPLYEEASEEVSLTAELFHAVHVGYSSLRETREIYHSAGTTLHIMMLRRIAFPSAD